MIHTTLSEISRFEGLTPNLKAAIDAIKTMKDEPFTAGRHDVDGDKAFVNCFEYDTKAVEDAQFEAHRKYIDVMYVYEGEEYIGYTPLEYCKNITKEYDDAAECLLAKLEPGMTKIHMQPGDICLLFPEDAHAPGLKVCESTHVKKFVGKVLL
ncbi:MAG: YhcH/YjgK/YiaL family protein [Eubacteriales bacterium]|nr:YhcH/YjgK/YiaL family protein [Eubacteriales bacterium]